MSRARRKGFGCGSLFRIQEPRNAENRVIAVLIATINIAGGFLVTQRMLKMFRKE